MEEEKKVAQTDFLSERMRVVSAMAASHHALGRQMEVLATSDDKEFCTAFCELVRLIEADFSGEEVWMDKLAYPEFKEHLEQHSLLLSVLHGAMSRVMNGDLAFGLQVMAQLPEWFRSHLTTMDSPLVACLIASDTSVASVHT